MKKQNLNGLKTVVLFAMEVMLVGLISIFTASFVMLTFLDGKYNALFNQTGLIIGWVIISMSLVSLYFVIKKGK
jgi:uncharacterized membrane protein